MIAFDLTLTADQVAAITPDDRAEFGRLATRMFTWSTHDYGWDWLPPDPPFRAAGSPDGQYQQRWNTDRDAWQVWGAVPNDADGRRLVDLLRRFGGQPTIGQLRGDLFRLAGGTAA